MSHRRLAGAPPGARSDVQHVVPLLRPVFRLRRRGLGQGHGGTEEVVRALVRLLSLSLCLSVSLSLYIYIYIFMYIYTYNYI